MADETRTPHPDVALAIAAANTSRQYHALRVSCMEGSYAEYYENARTNPNHKGGNPPVGEYCLGLLQNSADVNANQERLVKRPETSLLAPYLGMLIERGQADTASAAYSLAKAMEGLASSPANSNTTDAVRVGTTNPKYLVTPGVALDAAFTNTVMTSRHLPNGTIPPKPARNPEELYVTTDSCFRNTGVTLGECAQAGRDQAALYLNQGRAVTQIIAPAATPATTQPQAHQRRARMN